MDHVISRGMRTRWEGNMMQRAWWESFRVEHGLVTADAMVRVCEGSVRRVVIRHRDGWDVEEVRLTAGTAARALADMTAISALLGECTIRIERVDTEAMRVALMQTTAP